MTKRKSIRALLALALAFALSAGATVPAFAAGEATGTETSPASANITKELKMPAGTTTPAATFSFTITGVDKDGEGSSRVPSITAPTVTFAASDAGTTTGTTKTVSKTVDILGSTVFASAGDYTYTITENAPAWTGTGETMTYSPAVYTMHVFVENGTTAPYVKEIGITATTADNPGQSTGKVDLGTDKVVFTNTFSKKTVIDPTTGGVASISKTVAGNYADEGKYFPFEVLLTESPVTAGGTPATYKAYVVNASNTVVTSTDNYATLATDSYGDYIEVTSASQITISLKHGQRLVFSDVEIGATYAVNELASPSYIPEVDVVENGAASVNIPGTINTALSSGTRTVGDTGANTADFTNTRNSVPVTGLIINNLPFILGLVVVAGAFVSYIVVKSRKRAQASA